MVRNPGSILTLSNRQEWNDHGWSPGPEELKRLWDEYARE